MSPDLILTRNYYRTSILSIKQKILHRKTIPAKTIMLITIFDGISNDVIRQNKLYFNVLFDAYAKRCAYYSCDVIPLEYPFYYLRSDGFYHLQWVKCEVNKKTPSSRFIRENVKYAYFDNALWDILQIKEVREEYTKALVDYFIKTN